MYVSIESKKQCLKSGLSCPALHALAVTYILTKPSNVTLMQCCSLLHELGLGHTSKYHVIYIWVVWWYSRETGGSLLRLPPPHGPIYNNRGRKRGREEERKGETLCVRESHYWKTLFRLSEKVQDTITSKIGKNYLLWIVVKCVFKLFQNHKTSP